MAEQTPQYKCDMCGVTFKDPDALVKHREVHNASNHEQADLEQGTHKPAQNPSIPGQTPGLGPTLQQ